MGTRDLNRFKKTYSFYRAVPVLEVTGGGDITAVYAGTGLSGGGTEGDVTLTIDNSVVATLSGSTFSGDVIFNAGMSGSLTRLSGGQPYLVAGPNITLFTNSIGQIEITSSAGGGPGGSNTHIQVNSGGVFSGSGDFTYNGSRVFLTGSFAQGVTNTANGLYSFAGGINTVAQGNYSHAEGSSTQTVGETSHSEGYAGTAYGDASHVEGYACVTYNTFAHAEGFATTASGYASHSEGRNSTASGNYSHAEGGVSLASGESSHSEGYATTASAVYSHAEGDLTIASGDFSHTEGSGSKGFGTHSHAEGNNTHAVGNYSHSAGIFTIASGSGQNVVGKYNKRGNTTALFIVGNGTADDNANRSDILLVNQSSVVVSGTITATQGLSGSLTKLADGTSYLIEGSNITITSASNGAITISSAGGGGSPASPSNSVQYNNGGSFGGSANFTFDGSTVYLTGSFEHGTLSKATGVQSHAEGGGTNAQGVVSHAEGYQTTAVEFGSHAEGVSTTTTGEYSHAEGYLTTAAAYAAHAEGVSTTAAGLYSHAEGSGTTAVGNSSHTEGHTTEAHGDYSHAEGYYTHASGTYSHVAGLYTIASGSGQNVVGKYNKRDNTDSLFIVGNGSGEANAQRSDIFLVNSGSVMIGSGTVPSDTFFFASGTIGGTKKSLFTGDVVSSGTLNVNTIQPTTNNSYVEILGKGTHTYDLVASSIQADTVTGTSSDLKLRSLATTDIDVGALRDVVISAENDTGIKGRGTISNFGKLKATGGTSSSTYRVPVNLASSAPDINSTGPYASGYITEYTFTVPANSMIVAGDSIRGKFSAQKVGAKNGKMRVLFGSTVICERTMGSANTDLFMDFTVVAKSSSTQTSTSFWMENSIGSIYSHASPAENCASAVNITVEFQADAADMVLKTINLELWCS